MASSSIPPDMSPNTSSVSEAIASLTSLVQKFQDEVREDMNEIKNDVKIWKENIKEVEKDVRWVRKYMNDTMPHKQRGKMPHPPRFLLPVACCAN